MKTGMVRKLSITLGAASIFLAGCQEDVASTTNTEEAPPVTTLSAAVPPAPAAVPAPGAPPAPPAAPVERKIDPATVALSPGVAEVVKLAQSGIDESVLLAYVQNSTNAFNMSSDELIYLNDMGISGKVQAAMLERSKKLNDQQARTTAISNAPPIKVVVESTPPVEPPPAVSVAPAPVAVAPAPATVVVVPANAPQQVVHFYEPLAPYGSWMEISGHGWCWQPTVAVSSRSWRPYADRGRWVYSDCGWYWQSDYSWGWAPFHYGRWLNHSRQGWVWVPDTVWAGAWVSWRSSDSHCGWAPLPPSACYDPHRGFIYNGVTVGVDCDFGLGSSHFTFISKFRFLDRNPNHYFLPHTQHTTIYNNTTIINNYTVDNRRTVNNGGISARQLADLTRSDVRQVSVRPADENPSARPDRLTRDGDQYVIYRPRLEKPAVGIAKPVAKETLVGTFDEKKDQQRIAVVTPGAGKSVERATPSKSGNSTYNSQVPHWMQPDVKTPALWPGNTSDNNAAPKSAERQNPKATVERPDSSPRQAGSSPFRRNPSTGSSNPRETLTAPQPITSTPQPLTPPQPITSVPGTLTPPQPITSVPQPLTPPRPITSAPQPLTPPQPITSTPQPLTPPRPIASVPQYPSAPQPVRSTPSPLAPPQPVRSTPSTPAAPGSGMHYYDRGATAPRSSAPFGSTAQPTRPSYTPPAASQAPTFTPPARSIAQPAYTPPAQVSRPAPTAPPVQAYTPPPAPRPAPSAPAYTAPRAEAPPANSAPRPPAGTPSPSNNDGRRGSEGRR